MDAQSSKYLYFYYFLFLISLRIFYFIVLEVVSKYFVTTLQSLLTPHCSVNKHEQFEEKCDACREKKKCFVLSTI